MTHLVGEGLKLTEGEIPGSVRLFPLPDHVFLPDLPTPYRVFEPRYERLVEDLLELPQEDRWVGIPRLASGWQAAYEGSPAIEPVATVGRLVGATRTDDGHYLVVVRGMIRALLTEVPSDRPYRRARLSPFSDAGASDEDRAAARFRTLRALFAALRPLLDDAVEPIAEAVRDAPDLSTAVYRLGSVFVVDADARQRLLEGRSLDERMAIVEEALAVALGVARARVGKGSEKPS